MVIFSEFLVKKVKGHGYTWLYVAIRGAAPSGRPHNMSALNRHIFSSLRP